MKKSDIVLIALVLVIIVVSMFSTKGNIKEEEINYPLTLKGEVGFNEITYSEYKEMVDNDDSFAVVIIRNGCGWCEQFIPVMKEYAEENNVAITYLNTSNIKEEEYNELVNMNKYLKKNQWGTPTTLFMKGSRVIDVIDGARGKEDIEKFFKDKIVMGD